MKHETRRDPKRESSNEPETSRSSGLRYEYEVKPGLGGGMRSPRRADESGSGSSRGARKKK
jgi:hypothetical protein